MARSFGTGSNLTWGPGELAAGEEVEVEMRDGFSAVGAIVDDDAKAVIGIPLLSGDVTGFEQKVS